MAEDQQNNEPKKDTIDEAMGEASGETLKVPNATETEDDASAQSEASRPPQ